MLILVSIIAIIAIIATTITIKVISGLRKDFQEGLYKMGQDIGSELDNQLSGIPFFRTK